MGIRSLLSFALILIPVAVTIGILVGLDAYRSSSGKPPLFTPTQPTTPDGIPKNDNSVVNSTYCQKSYGIHPKSKGEEYTLNPNQWNWNEGDAGALCLHVTSLTNGSYATSTTAPAFWVTWQYPVGPASDPVHAFPNIELDTTGVFPVQLQKTNNINVDVEWDYGLGSDFGVTTDLATVTATTAANVAIDMFLDPDGTAAQNASAAKFEVMVWLGYISPSVAQPIGLAAGALTTQVLNGTTFSLYYGQNQFKQNVLTWYPSVVTKKFTGDLMPLIQTLYTITSVTVPSPTDYLGYIGIGSETYYALQNVTFSVPRLSMEVVKN